MRGNFHRAHRTPFDWIVYLAGGAIFGLATTVAVVLTTVGTIVFAWAMLQAIWHLLVLLA